MPNKYTNEAHSLRSSADLKKPHEELSFFPYMSPSMFWGRKPCPQSLVPAEIQKSTFWAGPETDHAPEELYGMIYKLIAPITTINLNVQIPPN